MFEQFTEKARQAVLKAQEYVRVRQQQDVQVAHLLKGMLDTDEAVVGFLLKKLGVNIADLNTKLGVIMDAYPKVYGTGTTYGSHLSPRLAKPFKRHRPPPNSLAMSLSRWMSSFWAF